MKIEIKDGVLQISEELQAIMNRIERVDELPLPFVTPALTKKASFVNRSSTGKCIVANEPLSAGELVCKASGSKMSRGFKYSWQIDENLHRLGPGALDHHCTDPTCELDEVSGDFVARREIQVGEILTFNYLTTEFDMSAPFQCACGAEGCFEMIRGFRYLSNDEKRWIVDRFGVSRYLRRFV